jgi:CHAD domain-containing protein/CYTH domain-containing protein
LVSDDERDQPGTHLEVEIKLEAPANAVLPDLSTLPGVASAPLEGTDDLDAVYFDTADLRLIRSGITLRRRTGGRDQGWHLKLPADNGARLEVHRPLGAQPRVVPPPLLALVKARLLGEPLAPVAHIRTTRARFALRSPDGARLAEVADDAVTAEAFPPPSLDGPGTEAPETAGRGADAAVALRWREIEVELDEGGPDLLEEARTRLLMTVARKAPSPSKLARTLDGRLRAEAPGPAPKNRGVARPVVARLRELAARLVGLDPRVRLGTEGAAGELRSVVRELDALLAVFRPLFASEPTEGLRRELARLGTVLERLHEAGTVHARLLARLAIEPPAVVVGPVRERVDAELGQEHRQARIELVRELNAPGHLALLRRLGAFVNTPPLTDVPVDREVKRRKALLAALTPCVAAAHRQTIGGDDVGAAAAATAQVRVAADIVVPLAGRKVAAYAEAARELEAGLAAAVEDVRARRALLALARRATSAGENAFTYGHLYAGLGPAVVAPALTRLTDAAAQWPLDSGS